MDQVKWAGDGYTLLTLRQREGDENYPDEGHGFQRIETQRDFSARVEEFLARHLGGRAIPRVTVAGTSAELR